jgi:hypothetical protein
MVGAEESDRGGGVVGPALLATVPNPFDRHATIVYQVAGPGTARIAIYDAAGCLVRTVVDREVTGGTHQAAWDGRDDHGSLLPEGVYFCKLTLEDFESARKLVLLR